MTLGPLTMTVDSAFDPTISITGPQIKLAELGRTHWPRLQSVRERPSRCALVGPLAWTSLQRAKAGFRRHRSEWGKAKH